MRKLLYLFLSFLLLLSACTGNKTGQADVAPVDSVDSVDSVAADSMEQLIAETPMPKAADELFDDFIFNFAANKKLQFNRITFPLVVVDGKHIDSISRKAWKMEHFFMHQGYYTIIFDNMKQMDLVKDTTIDHVVIEKIYLKRNFIKQYVFNRIRGLWMLQRIEKMSFAKSFNASFLRFYQDFAVDTAFQRKSLAETVQFTGPDPDDDFATMDGVITPDTWPAFAPELPGNMIYNIIYGQHYAPVNHKILVLRGIANGMELELTFKRIGGKWMLIKLNT